jgi:hypothetical protein
MVWGDLEWSGGEEEMGMSEVVWRSGVEWRVME